MFGRSRTEEHGARGDATTTAGDECDEADDTVWRPESHDDDDDDDDEHDEEDVAVAVIVIAVE